MKAIDRTLYLGYYVKQMKWELLKKFIPYASQKTGRSRMSIWSDVIQSVYKYNISILEYFQFYFFEKDEVEREKWAGTGTMYEFQRQANPLDKRDILDDKRLFYKNYQEFFVHKLYSLKELRNTPALTESLLKEHKTLVLKDATGKCGAGVKLYSTQGLNHKDLIQIMDKNQFDILETFIKQHSKIQELSPSAVNTIRIFTQIRKDGTFEILGCRMRIAVDCPVDNMAAGNLAAPVDEKTGKINGPAVYSDITKSPESIHPITGVPIIGFQIPYWNEILEMTKKASLKHPQNRSIGWDVVVTEDGPGFIEGNHDWCKLLWQMPVNEGLKSRLDV